MQLKRVRALIVACAVLAMSGGVCSATTSQTSTTKTPPRTHQSLHKSTAHKKSRKAATARHRGQQKIDSERANQIQQALIREHYLSGTPSGTWDNATQAAMQKYQADNGWQSKTTPDSRALIKLGLGPDQQHLLNPDSAMTTQSLQAHTSAAPTPNAPASSSTIQPQK